VAEKEFSLRGLRIIDFTHVASGPNATKILADLGAEVIKVEGPKRPDLIRRAGPFPGNRPGLNSGGMYNSWNTSKLSLTLDLGHSKGVDLVRRLICFSDVVIDNFSPRVMERWGLAYKDLVQLKPDIIVVNLPSQGMTGPHREYISFGAELMALGGIACATGFSQGRPTGPDVNYPDYPVASLAAFAILAALRFRKKTGKGQHIDLSQFEVTVSLWGPAMMDFIENQRLPIRRGNSSAVAAPYGVYRCQGEERWCAIAVSDESQWQNLCRAMGKPELAQDSRFQTLLARLKNASVLDEIIEQWTLGRSPEEVMATLQKREVPSGVVQNGKDLLQDPHLKKRGYYIELPHPEEKKMLYQRPAMILSRTPARVKRAPILGEHRDYVLRAILKLTAAEIAELVQEGACN